MKNFIFFIALLCFCLLTLSKGHARTEIELKPSSALLLSQIDDNELSVRILYPGINPGWGTCGIEITAWDAAPEFKELSENLIFKIEGQETPVSLDVSIQEPQGWIKADFMDSLGAYRLNLNIQSKNGEHLSGISKRLFGNRALVIYPVGCVE